MKRGLVLSWVLSVCSYVRRSQAKTLGALVFSAMRIRRASLADLGRQIGSKTSAKHRIKQASRFVANRRFEIADVMRGVVAALLERRKKRLLVALDWTDLRGFNTLVASAVIKGRGVPLLWCTYEKWEFYRSQNNLEEGLMRLLRTMIPKSVPVVMLADRGFGRTEFGRLCQELEFNYVIRISPDVWIRSDQYAGKLLDHPVRKGIARLLLNVEYRKNNPVRQNVVIRWKPGLPEHRDETWFLMTDLKESPVSLSELYAKRMTIEEFFRDAKNTRNGFALRQMQLEDKDRIDRLLLILILAFFVLTGIGLIARKALKPGAWSDRNTRNDYSNFAIGRLLVADFRVRPSRAFQAVRTASERAA